jgi:multicomponent Na+:H+ antiporter subunit E
MFVLNLLLALAWMLLTGQFELSNFIAGIVLGYLMLWLGQTAVGESDFFSSQYFVKVRQVVVFIIFFLWELLIANLRVTYHILSPLHKMRPGVVAIPLDVTRDVEIMLLANLITLTPGTLSLDVSKDRRTLYIHTIAVDDLEAFKQSIKNGLELRVREVFQ